MAFRVLAAGNFPKHRTLCDFRALHLSELAALFVQVVKLARECGLVKLGMIAVDGTKLRANASKHKAMSYARMQAAEAELKAQIDALLTRAARSMLPKLMSPNWDIPAEIERREHRLQAIEAAKLRLVGCKNEAEIDLFADQLRPHCCSNWTIGEDQIVARNNSPRAFNLKHFRLVMKLVYRADS